MRIRKEIGIFIIGKVHSDFTLIPSLIPILKTLHEKKIPLAFLEEGPSDQSLKQVKKTTEKGNLKIQSIKFLIPEIQAYYSEDANSPHYLKKDAFQPIFNILKNNAKKLQIDPENTAHLKQLTFEIYRENTYIKEIELYNELLKLKIPYSGIDSPAKIYEQQILSVSANPENYFLNEPFRIYTILENLSKFVTDFDQDGIIIINIGGKRSHRLAANILYQHQTNPHSFPECNLHVNVFNYCSSFVEGMDASFDVKLTSNLDSDEIKEIYQTLPCEKVSEYFDGNSYSIPHLESLITNFVGQHLKMPEPQKVSVIKSNASGFFNNEESINKSINPQSFECGFSS